MYVFSPKILDLAKFSQVHPPEAPISNHLNSHFIGLSESAEIFEFQGVLCMQQLAFVSCHHLIPNKKNMLKGCLRVIANLGILAMAEKKTLEKCRDPHRNNER